MTGMHLLVDVHCSQCRYVARHEAADVTLHHNPDDGFSLAVVDCPLCGDLALAAPGPEVAALLEEAGTRVMRLHRTD